MTRRSALVLTALISLLQPSPRSGAAEPAFDRKEDVIYGRKYGTALTMDIFTPKPHPNGAGVIMIVSGAFFSSHEAINPAFFRPLLDRGYTVFAVVHGSQPKFTVPEILDDLHRAVRFIRHHAPEYGVDPNRIGVTGASAGGHLSLMLGTTARWGNPFARDPVDREPSRVQAVACFCPASDFLNFGKSGENALGRGRLEAVKAPFDFQVLDKTTKSFKPVVDHAVLLEIGRQISPVYHVSRDDAPTLIFHGDADPLIPIQQSQSMIAKLKAAGVDAELVTKPGAGHAWPGMISDMSRCAEWFDRYLMIKANK